MEGTWRPYGGRNSLAPCALFCGRSLLTAGGRRCGRAPKFAQAPIRPDRSPSTSVTTSPTGTSATNPVAVAGTAKELVLSSTQAMASQRRDSEDAGQGHSRPGDPGRGFCPGVHRDPKRALGAVGQCALASKKDEWPSQAT